MNGERLNALLVLEKGGYTFDLTPGGGVTHHAPAASPQAWVMTRAVTLLPRLRAERVRAGLFQMGIGKIA